MNRLTLFDAIARAKAIENLGHDPQAQHSEADRLCLDVLNAIAHNVAGADAQGLASVAYQCRENLRTVWLA